MPGKGEHLSEEESKKLHEVRKENNPEKLRKYLAEVYRKVDEEALVECVTQEIDYHQKGLLDRLSSNSEWARAFEASPGKTSQYLNKLPKDKREYRFKQLQLQVHKGRILSEANRKRISEAHKKIDEEALVECMIQEIEYHQKGLLERLSSNDEWARAFGYSKGGTICKYLAGLPKELRDYRYNRILSRISKGKTISEAQKRAISQRQRKLNDDQMAILSHHYVSSVTPLDELIEVYNLTSTAIHRYLRVAAERGWITKEEIVAAGRKRRSEAGKKKMSPEFLKKISERNRKLDDNQTAILAHHFVNSDTPINELRAVYGISYPTIIDSVKRAVSYGWFTKEEISEARKRRFAASRPNKGKTMPEKQRQKISIANRKLDDNEIALFAHHFAYSDTSMKDLSVVYGVKYHCLHDAMKKAIDMGWITEEEYKSAKRRRLLDRAVDPERRDRLSKAHLGKHPTEKARKNLSEAKRKIDDNDMAIIAHWWINSETPVEEIAENYHVHKGTIYKTVKEAVKRGWFTQEERKAAELRRKSNFGTVHSEETKDKISLATTGRVVSDESLERMCIAAANREKNKPKKYYVENRFYADSLTEGVTALLLERYVPGFKIEHGKTFQENGDTSKVFDFILEDAIFEWHPINLHNDGTKYLPEVYAAYQWHENTMKRGDRRALSELAKELKDLIAPEYWFERQDASDKSPAFKGKEVFLARDVQELYDFISRYNKNMLSYQKFNREFGGICKYVKQFERKPQKSKELEQKVEVAGVAGA